MDPGNCTPEDLALVEQWLQEANAEDPVGKLLDLIDEAKPALRETKQLRRRELGRRGAIQQRGLERATTGEEAQRASLGALKGELPKAQFEPVRNLLDPLEINDLKMMIRDYYVAASRKGRTIPSAPTYVAFDKILDGGLPNASELKLLADVFGKEIAEALLRKRGLGPKAAEEAFAAISLWRTFITGGEQSIVLRQAIIPSINPLNIPMTARNVKASLQAGVSEEATRTIHEAWRATPEWQRLEEAGKRINYILFTDWEGAIDPLAREENFTLLERTMVGRLAKRIPGLGHYLNFSNRGAVTFLNGTRLELGAKYLRAVDNALAKMSDADIIKEAQRYGFKVVDKNGKPIPVGRLRRLLRIEGEEDAARTMAVFSGRGKIPTNQAVQIAGRALFSAQRQASIIQTPFLLLQKNPAVRKLVARDIATFLGMGMSLLAAAKFSGALDVELDLRSADAFKIKLGPMRIDPWGGFQQYARLIAQLATGKRKVALGDIQKISRQETFMRFWDMKLNPALALTTDLYTGENPLGEKMEPTLGTVKREAFNRLLPLITQDVVDAFREMGSLGGPIAVPLAWFGVGVQTYTPQSVKVAQQIGEDLQRGVLTDTYDNIPVRPSDLTSGDEDRFRAAHPEFVEQRTEAEAESERGQFTIQRVKELGLAEMANRIAAGETALKEGFAQSYDDIRGDRAIVSGLEVAGFQFPDPRTEAGRLKEEYFNIKPVAYRDPETGVIDYRQFYRAQDEVLDRLSKLDPTAAETMRSKPILDVVGDPALSALERDYLHAKALRRQLYDMSPLAGLSGEQYDEAKDFLRDVREFRKEQRSLGNEISPSRAVGLLARQRGESAQWAWSMENIRKDQMPDNPNDEYVGFLLAHRAELQPYFPDLYSSNFMIDVVRLNPDKQLVPAGR